jgi:hypothetical protein
MATFGSPHVRLQVDALIRSAAVAAVAELELQACDAFGAGSTFGRTMGPS